ncbi:MAG: hypothetical protein JW864_09210 [Spirochaetes bacterium]|nr:hypothetical protein [Spirochaetota bacterium]
MRKVRFIKFVALVISILIILLAVSTFLVVYYYPRDKVLSIVVTKAEEILNRKVVISGIKYGLNGINLTDITIYSKDDSGQVVPETGVFASAQTANIRFSLIPLLNKKFVISKIILNNLKLNIIYKDEMSNIESLLQDIKSNGGSGTDIETRITAIGLENAELTLKDPPEILKPLEGTYLFNGTLYLDRKDRTEIRDCKVILPGKRGVIESDDVDIYVYPDDFLVTGDYKLENCSLLWVYTWVEGFTLPYQNFTGNINALKVSKKMVNGFAVGKSLLTNSKFARVDGQCKVDIENSTVELLNIEGKLEKSVFFINEIMISYSSQVEDLILKFNITEIDSYVNDLRPVLPFLPDNASGRVIGNLNYYNHKLNGNITLNNASYYSGKTRVLRINGEIPVVNSNIHIEKLPAFIYNQPCTLSISTSGDNFQKILLNIYAAEFRYSTDESQDAGKSFSVETIQSEITGLVEIGNLYIDDYNFSDIYLNYSFINGILNLNRISSIFLNGNIEAKGFLDIKSSIPYVDLKTNFTDIKVQDLSKFDDDLTGRIYGTASGNVNFEFGIEKGKSLFESLKAKIEVEVDKGKLVNTGLQKSLSVYLSELKYKLKDIEFNKIYGNASILENNCYINSMLFNSPDVRLKVNGYFIIPAGENKKYPGELKYILEFNDYFIQDIPNLPQAQLIGRLLKIPTLKKEGDWYIMSFQARGDDIADSRNIKPLGQ